MLRFGQEIVNTYRHMASHNAATMVQPAGGIGNGGQVACTSVPSNLRLTSWLAVITPQQRLQVPSPCRLRSSFPGPGSASPGSPGTVATGPDEATGTPSPP